MLTKAALLHATLTFIALGQFSRWQIYDLFQIFPKKQTSIFQANCLQICMECQSQFSGKNKKHISKCCLLTLAEKSDQFLSLKHADLALTVAFKIVADILFSFHEKLKLDISCEASRQIIHMKSHLIFVEKNYLNIY